MGNQFCHESRTVVYRSCLFLFCFLFVYFNCLCFFFSFLFLLQAVCLEMLGLYRKPRLFLFDLEKRLNVLKEEYAKKQVEIKEVTLKKPVVSSSPASK